MQTADLPLRKPLAGSRLWLAGNPASAALENAQILARQIVGQIASDVAPCRTPAAGRLGGDITAITREFVEYAASILDGRPSGERLARIGKAAARWADEGVPIDTVHHAIHRGVSILVDRLAARCSTNGNALDCAVVIEIGIRLVGLLDDLTTTVAAAYMAELHAVSREHHKAASTLAAALLGGRNAAMIARESGIAIAETYSVVAVAIPAHPHARNPSVADRGTATLSLSRLRAELAARCGPAALSLLNPQGGTMLIPSASEPVLLDELIAALSTKAGVAITAAAVESKASDIPEAYERAHKLLAIGARMSHHQRGPRLFRFDDLAVEYQLARPGPARERLLSILDPLDPHPDLLLTLRVYIDCRLNRKQAARALIVHPNTLSFRLKRITELTGFNPTDPAQLWYLRSAVFIHQLA